jgi:hypothetical protein
MFILNNYAFGSSVDHDVANVTLQIYEEDDDAGPF